MGQMATRTDIREKFFQAMAEFGHAEGMSPIACRMFALLVYDGGPIGFGALAERLGVSRASISTNARALETRGLLMRTKLPGERGDFFDLPPDTYRKMLAVTAARAAAMHEVVGDILDTPELGEDAPRRARLRDVAAFFAEIEHLTQSAAVRLTGEIR